MIELTLFVQIMVWLKIDLRYWFIKKEEKVCLGREACDGIVLLPALVKCIIE